MIDGRTVAAIMPALNEAGVIGATLAGISDAIVDRVWVADNGSHDGTAAEAALHGAHVIREPRRGYGAACQAAIRALSDGPAADIVVFMDADGSQDPADLPRLLRPIAADAADLVIGVRRADAVPLHVARGNRLACAILHVLTGHRFHDLGPFRAIRFDALRGLGLRDPDYGWNVEMQARAIGAGLRVAEVPVAHRPRRAGRSKISGSAIGTIRAGGKILWTAVQQGMRVRRGRAARSSAAGR